MTITQLRGLAGDDPDVAYAMDVLAAAGVEAEVLAELAESLGPVALPGQGVFPVTR